MNALITIEQNIRSEHQEWSQIVYFNIKILKWFAKCTFIPDRIINFSKSSNIIIWRKHGTNLLNCVTKNIKSFRMIHINLSCACLLRFAHILPTVLWLIEQVCTRKCENYIQWANWRNDNQGACEYNLRVKITLLLIKSFFLKRS